MIRVLLPYHLSRLANTEREISLQLDGPVTQRTILDALEQQYPVLCGTIRDIDTGERRAFIRFFACGRDISHESSDILLPEAVTNGKEKFMIIGAMVGG
jgi:hypothetical protein